MSDEPREPMDAAAPAVQVTDKRRLFTEADAADAPADASAETPPDAGAAAPAGAETDLHRLRLQLEERESQIARLRAQVVEYEAKVQEELRETRRRLERTVEQRVLNARQTLLEDWLAVFDNLDLMLAGAEKATREDLLTGLAAMQRLLVQALQRHEVERIEAVGRPFDPELHEAVETATVAPEQDGQVVAQSRAGYRLSGRLIRPALVTVGRAERASAVLSETEIPA